MSKAKAKRSINLEDFKKSMESIFSTSIIEETLNESLFAYKYSQTLMSDIGDIVEILDQLKPVYNFKHIK
ncbi:MAG: RtcB family protein [Erysipelotrichaceae bacterium]|nr:RtcB family protein [Erysipelotrichaceae bacterium]